MREGKESAWRPGDPQLSIFIYPQHVDSLTERRFPFLGWFTLFYGKARHSCMLVLYGTHRVQ